MAKDIVTIDNNEYLQGDDIGYSARNLGYMKSFATEYPDFLFLQARLANITV